MLQEKHIKLILSSKTLSKQKIRVLSQTNTKNIVILHSSKTNPKL